MKLAVAYSQDEVETLGVSKSQNFGFSKDAEEMIFTMFTKNIYSNPIGSVVREITSNCFDSHKEAGVNEPVIVKLTKENNSHYISFVDVGVGMSPERITKVYAQYFNSTKRNDNNQIGGFGIGGKTPLAYAESFFLITIFNGFKYTYSIRKGTKSPVLDLLGREKTKDHNGTTVKIPIKNTDVSTFEREINRQLYYFNNVIFEGFSTAVKNDYRIVEGKNFLYRGRDYNSYAHICLGSVAYPIDWSVLESDDDFYQGNWDVPVAIKMEIGDINVTVSREAIDYTGDAVKIIKKKLNAVKAELLEMLNKQNENIDSLEEYYRLEDSYSTLLLSKNDAINIHSFTDNNPLVYRKLNEIEIPSQSEIIYKFYDSSLIGKKKKRESTWDKSLRNAGTDRVYFLNDNEETSRKKNAYMKHCFKHFYTLKRKKFSISDVKYFIEQITPTNSTVDSKIIFKQFRQLQKEVYSLVEKKVKSYSSVVVPDGFKVSKSKSYDPNYELPLTIKASGGGFYKEKVKVSDLMKSKATIYYGDLDSELKISLAHLHYVKLFSPKGNTKFDISYNDDSSHPVRFIMVAKNNLKYIADMKNAKPISEFDSILLRKRNNVIQSIEKNKFISQFNEQNELFLNYNLFNTIDKDYGKTIKAIQVLKEKYSKIKSIDLNLEDNSPIMRLLKIDSTKIKHLGSELFSIVNDKTEKNGMLCHVSIRSNFDPKSKVTGYTEKEIADILQLFSLAYVK